MHRNLIYLSIFPRRKKCFVIVATAFTLMGIVYGFWYKNFGPGKKMPEKFFFN
jgi:hypothetical protein